MSLRLSVDRFCKSCIYDPANAGAGSWRQQVEDCCSRLSIEESNLHFTILIIVIPLGINDDGETGGREGVNNYAANPSVATQ